MKLPPDIEIFRKMGMKVIIDPDCPSGSLFFLAKPDPYQRETIKQYAKRCATITNIAVPKKSKRRNKTK